MSVNQLWTGLTIGTMGLFLGYVSGLATQPILALIGSAILAVGGLLLSLFKVAKLSDEEGLSHLRILTEIAPQANPYRFFLGTLVFAVSTSVGVNFGISQRTATKDVDVSEEARQIAVQGMQPHERVALIHSLKTLYAKGFNREERLFVFSEGSNAESLTSTQESIGNQLNPPDKSENQNVASPKDESGVTNPVTSPKTDSAVRPLNGPITSVPTYRRLRQAVVVAEVQESADKLPDKSKEEGKLYFAPIRE